MVSNKMWADTILAEVGVFAKAERFQEPKSRKASRNRKYEYRGMFLFFRPVRRSRKTKVIYLERKTFRRIIRDRHLTEAERVADEKIRSQVVQEFPPFDLAVPQAGCISEALRRAIQSSPKSVYQICKETGISQIVVSRFLPC